MTPDVNGHPGRRWRTPAAVVTALLVCWLPWLLAMWPGIATADTWTEIRQAFGQLAYSDQHPLAFTLYMQAILRPAVALTGSMNTGFAILAGVNMVLLAITTGLCVAHLGRIGAPRWAVWAATAFYALNPVIGCYSITLWKDIWLSTFLLAVATTAVDVVRRVRAGEQVPRGLWVLLGLAALGAMLMKKNGLYIVVPTAILTLPVLRGARWRWSAVMCGALAAFLLVHAALVAATGATPGPRREAFSLPLQQIARVVRDHRDDLDAGQRSAIDRFFPDADPGLAYDPRIADPVKRAFDDRTLPAGTGELLGLWAGLCTEFRGSCWDAFTEGTSGYWASSDYIVIRPYSWADEMNGSDTYSPVLDPADEGRSHVRPQYRQDIRVFVERDLRAIPVLGWMAIPGAWFWACAALAVVAVVRRSRPAVPAAALAGMTWVTCLLSPVYAEARYAYPMLLIIPVLAVAALLPARGRD